MEAEEGRAVAMRRAFAVRAMFRRRPSLLDLVVAVGILAVL